MADDKSKAVDPKDAEIAALKSQLAGKSSGGEAVELAKMIATAVAAALRPDAAATAKLRKNLPLAAEHKGTKTYVVGPSRHYRNGKMYLKGELVTVTDERPARDWKLYDPAAGTPIAQADAAAPVGRASDRTVG